MNDSFPDEQIVEDILDDLKHGKESQTRNEDAITSYHHQTF